MREDEISLPCGQVVVVYVLANRMRTIGMLVSVAAAFAYAASLLEKETESNAHIFYVGNMFGSLSTLLNAVTRTRDHLHNEEKRWNVRAGILESVLLSGNAISALLSALKVFRMPVGVVPFLNSIYLLTGAVLNWEPKNTVSEKFKANWARISCVVGVPPALYFAYASIMNSDTKQYFLSSAFYDLAILFGILNRIVDILWTNADKTSLLNKAAIILFSTMMATTMVVNLLASLDKLGQGVELPIAFPGVMMNLAVFFYFNAQTQHKTHIIYPRDFFRFLGSEAPTSETHLLGQPNSTAGSTIQAEP